VDARIEQRTALEIDVARRLGAICLEDVKIGSAICFPAKFKGPTRDGDTPQNGFAPQDTKQPELRIDFFKVKQRIACAWPQWVFNEDIVKPQGNIWELPQNIERQSRCLNRNSQRFIDHPEKSNSQIVRIRLQVCYNASEPKDDQAKKYGEGKEDFADHSICKNEISFEFKRR